MRRWNYRGRVAALSVAATVGLLISQSTTAMADEVPLEPEDSSSLVHVDLSAPLSLDDAVELGDTQDLDVVGYYYDNGQVVGEFYPGQLDVSEFKAEFADDYGTEPAVTQLVTLADDSSMNASSAQSKASPLIRQTSIPTNKRAFRPKSVNPAKLKALFGPVAPRKAVPASATSLATAAASTTHGSWAPDSVNVQVLRAGTHQYVNNILTWDTTSNNNVPADFGMEVGTNFISTSLPSNKVRSKEDRYCDGVDVGPSFRKAKFIGANYGWSSWSATSSEGKVGAGKAYADYNDLFDKCNLNSMTIGFRYPRLIPGDSLITRIDAPKGGVSSNELSGEISLVHDDCGSSNGSGAGGLTDCMGLRDIDPPASAHNPRLTLNASRHWTAGPEKCWNSSNFGLAAPAAYTCP